jgi:hypothetical protein
MTAKIENMISNAIDTGDIYLALSLANSVEYANEIEATATAFRNRPKESINTLSADNASKRCGFDFEGAILTRDENRFFGI